jgi:hypothetical protein
MGTLKDPEILMNTGLIVELSGCNSTATAVQSSQGYSTTVVSQPFLAPRSTVETSMEGGSAIVLATSDTAVSDGGVRPVSGGRSLTRTGRSRLRAREARTRPPGIGHPLAICGVSHPVNASRKTGSPCSLSPDTKKSRREDSQSRKSTSTNRSRKAPRRGYIASASGQLSNPVLGG